MRRRSISSFYQFWFFWRMGAFSTRGGSDPRSDEADEDEGAGWLRKLVAGAVIALKMVGRRTRRCVQLVRSGVARHEAAPRRRRRNSHLELRRRRPANVQPRKRWLDCTGSPLTTTPVVRAPCLVICYTIIFRRWIVSANFVTVCNT